MNNKTEKANTNIEKTFYRAKDIAFMISCSTSQIYVLRSKGFLPKPLKFGKISLWKKEDVENLLNTIYKGVDYDPLNADEVTK